MRVSKNSYYYWQKNGSRKEKASLEHLKTRIISIFHENRKVYGSDRIQKQLEREGLIYSRSYIARLMRKMGLRSVLKKNFVITTDSSHHYPISDNLMNRNFTSYEIGEKWVSDITYVKVENKWNYLTVVLDLADRKVVGWTLSDDMTTSNTVYKAWLKAISNRTPKADHIFHSDRGIQYASNKFSDVFKHSKMNQSMSRKGNCWDNAVAESFFKTIKYECLNRINFSNQLQLFQCIQEYIDWYNTKRLHSSLGYLTPLEKEVQLRKLSINAA